MSRDKPRAPRDIVEHVLRINDVADAFDVAQEVVNEFTDAEVVYFALYRGYDWDAAEQCGWQRCSSGAGKCGAYNTPNPRSSYVACLRPRGHTGKHDDMWTPPWGDPEATAEQTIRDAKAEWDDVMLWARPMGRTAQQETE